MTTAPPVPSEATGPAVEQRLKELLDRQRQSYLSQGPPTAQQRIDRLDRAVAVLVDHEREIVAALSEDFGHRSPDASRMTDVAASIEPLKFAKKHLADWMKPEKRKVQFPLNLLGAKARIEYQPLGVVGIVAPWNFPVNMVFAPLAGALAAGNRVMIKPSEHTPKSSDLVAKMIAEAYDETEVAVVLGGPEVGQAFTTLPFDHLLFTGSTSIARHVMRAASQNLVPVTLELGGKSPVVVGKDADLEDVANKVMNGKCLNAGQICLAPDYVFVPAGRRDELVAKLKDSLGGMYGDGLRENPDYTSVINERHVERLRSYLDDARARGAEVIELNPREESFEGTRKMPPTLVLDPTEEMKVMQDEIFGPILPIKTYDKVDEVIDYVNHHDRPLALYYFGPDGEERDRVLSRTTSGGVSVNDVIMHVAQEDLPFGGVGPSGMGNYHGREGFETFSHAKSIYTQAKIDVGKMIRPPYGSRMRKYVSSVIKK